MKNKEKELTEEEIVLRKKRKKEFLRLMKITENLETTFLAGNPNKQKK